MMELSSITQDIFFILLYGGVLALELVAALYILFRKGNAFVSGIEPPVRLRRWTAFFLATLAIGHLYWMYFALHPSAATYITACLLDVLFIIISVAGIMLAMLQDRKRHIWPVLVSLVPLVVWSVLGIVRKDIDLLRPARIYVILLVVLFTVYMVFAIRIYGRWLRDNFADLEHKEFWQSILVLAVLLLTLLFYGYTDSNIIFLYSIQAVNILVVGLMMWRVETLRSLDSSDTVAEEPSKDDMETPSSNSVPDTIGPQLKKYCEDTLLFLQYDLTLAQLAQAIGTNRYYLSQYFSRQGLTYNAYINGLRVEHFIRLYHRAVAGNRVFTANQLSAESGFHSYSTFSAAFKQKMGKTVTAWMIDAKE